MMNLPKLRGAKFLEDQSIRSAKYDLTSELKKKNAKFFCVVVAHLVPARSILPN